jgi:endonuclease YncB( thermonuclease family)
MIRIALLVITVIVFSAGLLTPEASKNLFSDGSITPAGIIAYLIAGAIFLWLITQILRIANMILKFAVLLSALAFLGIATITLIDGVNTKEGENNPTIIEKIQATLSGETEEGTNTDKEQGDKEQNSEKLTPKEEENLSFIDKFKRKFFMDNQTTTNESDKNNNKNTTKEDDTGKIIYDKQGNKIGIIDSKGNFTQFNEIKIELNAERAQITSSGKPVDPKTYGKAGSSGMSFTQRMTNPLPIAPSSELVVGKAEAVSGDTISINGHWITLFAIDAPHKTQHCYRFSGESYPCGLGSTKKMENIITGKKVSCRALAKTSSGDYLAICSDGLNDIGATMVRTGWALAYRDSSDVYAPYEDHARKDAQGIWQGHFTKPWKYKAGQ